MTATPRMTHWRPPAHPSSRIVVVLQPPHAPSHPIWQKPKFQPGEISVDKLSELAAVAPSSELSQANIVGAILAIPASFFFSPNETAPAEWGYTATVVQKARGSDQAAFSVKFHDGTSKFYLEKHPKCTQAEIDAGVEERYLKHPDVKVLALGKAS